MTRRQRRLVKMEAVTDRSQTPNSPRQVSPQVHSLVQQPANHHYSAHHAIKQQVARRLYLTDIGRDVTPAQPQMPRTHSSAMPRVLLTRRVARRAHDIVNRSKYQCFVTFSPLLSKILAGPRQGIGDIGTNRNSQTAAKHQATAASAFSRSANSRSTCRPIALMRS